MEQWDGLGEIFQDLLISVIQMYWGLSNCICRFSLLCISQSTWRTMEQSLMCY